MKNIIIFQIYKIFETKQNFCFYFQMELRLVDRVQCVDSKNNNTLPNRTLIIRRLEKHDAVKSKSLLQKDEVFFLQIPALAPTIGLFLPIAFCSSK